jgi:arylsulfatase A-like enzyme
MSVAIRTRSTAPFHGQRSARRFQRDEVREKVIPAYMGLIKQCDDELGRL